MVTPGGPELSVTCETSDDGLAHVVVLSGELDLMTVPAVRAAVSGLEGDVTIDLRDVSFIDSTGLGLLLMLNARQRQHERTLSLRGVSRKQYATFALTGIADMFDIEPLPAEY